MKESRSPIEKSSNQKAKIALCKAETPELKIHRIQDSKVEIITSDDVLYLQNGFYRFNGKWKQRGIGKLGSKEIEHLDTIQRENKLYYSFKVNRVGRLRNSIITNNRSNIGKFQICEKQINLNADRKLDEIGKLHFNLGEILQFVSKNDSGTTQYVGSI